MADDKTVTVTVGDKDKKEVTPTEAKDKDAKTDTKKRVVKAEEDDDDEDETYVDIGIATKTEIVDIDSIGSYLRVKMFMQVGYTPLDEKTKQPKFIKADAKKSKFTPVLPDDNKDIKECIPTIQFGTSESTTDMGRNTEVNWKTGELNQEYTWLLQLKVGLSQYLGRFPFDRHVLFFPFEAQELEYVFKKDWMIEKDPRFLEESHTHGIISCSSSEWELLGYQITYYDGSEAVMTVWVQRKAAYYLANYGLVTFFLVLLNSVTIVMSVTDYGTRMSTSLTLLLTLIAFKLAMSSSLPKIPYVTLMDIYMLIAVGVLVAEVIWNAVIVMGATSGQCFGFSTETLDPGLAVTWKQVDTIVLAVITAFWIILHIFLLLCLKFDFLRESWDSVESKLFEQVSIEGGADIWLGDSQEAEAKVDCGHIKEDGYGTSLWGEVFTERPF